MIPVSSSPLENLAAFGLTFIVGVLAALSLTIYYRRVKGDASAYRCRYPPDPTPRRWTPRAPALPKRPSGEPRHRDLAPPRLGPACPPRHGG